MLLISKLKFILQGLTVTGLKVDQIFLGDINTVYKSGNTIVDMKVDSYSNVGEILLSLILILLHSAFFLAK